MPIRLACLAGLPFELARLRPRLVERRIEVLALNFANDLVHDTVAALRKCRQALGNLLEETIAVFHGQRTRGGKDGVQLAIG
jgi:hypothetical protein